MFGRIFTLVLYGRFQQTNISVVPEKYENAIWTITTIMMATMIKTPPAAAAASDSDAAAAFSFFFTGTK